MRAIDADALLTKAKDVLITDGKGNCAKYRCIDTYYVHAAPTIEQPGVVRCPGCVYKKTCIHTMNGVDPDGFCKWGETATMFGSVKE